jgi:hypothetical protein
MPFLYVGVGGLVVPTYYVGRQAHLCESRRVDRMQANGHLSERIYGSRIIDERAQGGPYLVNTRDSGVYGQN